MKIPFLGLEIRRYRTPKSLPDVSNCLNALANFEPTVDNGKEWKGKELDRLQASFYRIYPFVYGEFVPTDNPFVILLKDFIECARFYTMANGVYLSSIDYRDALYREYVEKSTDVIRETI